MKRSLPVTFLQPTCRLLGTGVLKALCTGLFYGCAMPNSIPQDSFEMEWSSDRLAPKATQINRFRFIALVLERHLKIPRSGSQRQPLWPSPATLS